MKQCRLILMEGLPSTGKSTNSGILYRQFERNGFRARWVHEMARPHPTLFFFEAWLKSDEYSAFLSQFPDAVPVIDQYIVNHGSSFSLDLLELEWSYQNRLSSQAIDTIKQYDVWNFSIERYMKAALEKWQHFANRLIHSDETVLLDSSIYQYQIYSLLLANVPYHVLETFIGDIYEILSPLNPKLIYFYRENTNDTIDYLVKERGPAFLQRIWERDKNRPYYQDRPKGTDGYKMFLQDYGEYAKRLFDSAPITKLSIEITESKWSKYVNSMMNFTNLSYMVSPEAIFPNGTYFNHELNQTIDIVQDRFIVAGIANKTLIAKSSNEFYLHDMPVIIKYEYDRLIITGEQLCDRWTTSGTEYIKVRKE